MRVHFSSLTTPKDKAKALKDTLADMGLARSLTECREALSILYGYSGWDELVTVHRKAMFEPTPLGEETDDGLTRLATVMVKPLRITYGFATAALRGTLPGRLGRGPSWSGQRFGEEFWSALEANVPFHSSLVMMEGDDYVLLVPPGNVGYLQPSQILDQCPGLAYCIFGVTMEMLFETVTCRPVAPFHFGFDLQGRNGPFCVRIESWERGNGSVRLRFRDGPGPLRGPDGKAAIPDPDDRRITSIPPSWSPSHRREAPPADPTG